MTTARARRRAAAAALAAFALLAAGCGADSAARTPITNPPATIAPPSTTEAGTAGDQSALANAINRYQAVYTSVYVNPRQDLSVIDTVAAGEEAASLRDQAAQVAKQGLVASGSITVLRVKVDSVSPSPVAGGPTTANVTTCNDVSGLTIKNPDGSSNSNPNRLPQTQSTFQLQNPTPHVATGWRVIQGRSGPTVPCDPV